MTMDHSAYASLKESEFGKYTQDDVDLLMDKVRIIYGENASETLIRAYKEWWYLS